MKRFPRLRRVKIAVARETRDGESRVAMVPELVGKLTELGYDVAVEPGAGQHALIADEEYVEAGATVDEAAFDGRGPGGVGAAAAAASRAPAAARDLDDVVPADQPGAGAGRRAARLRRHVVRDGAGAADLAGAVDGRAVSQALVAGYRCAIVAAGMLRRFFPLNMTAAGTVQPATIVVLGAGVAGLQAIATAKRLGAVVKAYDVRAAAAEEIRSMGAQAIELELETLEGAGGYAREMTEERAARQRELLAPYIAEADGLITTAAVPGRQAPMLVTAEMVEQMRPGSVVVDLAAETGGNVEGAVPGEVVRIGNAQVWGGRNVPRRCPGRRRRLYAQNIVNIVTLMTRTRDDEGAGAFAPDFEDEIVIGACVTRDGAIRPRGRPDERPRRGAGEPLKENWHE